MKIKTTKVEVNKNTYIAIDDKEFQNSWECEQYEKS